MAIPKEWAEKLKLKKGELVSIELEENDIVVSPTKSRLRVQSRSLEIDHFKARAYTPIMEPRANKILGEIPHSSI